RTAVAATLVTFNCVACHVRDDFGGVSEELNPVFGTDEKELGEEARIPPPLTLVGAKLQSVTLKKVLFDGESVRPYMFTRMPQFGERNLHHLPDLFARLDSVPPFELILPKPEPRGQKDRDLEKDLRAGGRELVGDKGLYCVACHTFNGKAPNKRGIDLSTFAERLKPNWYYHYMLNPAAFRPRAVMPTAWPGGMAVHKTILDGDTDKQISAIWYYLSLGTSAQDPSGIRHTETQIAVTDTARTYRGRSGVAGFRGIAVGFPERLHYAFNAETGSLTAVWQGDFIRVNWSGQGSGDFHPVQRHVQLPQDVGILALDNESTPWPLRPVMTKEAPANPDPLYPKNRGYQFQGYFFDDASVPTLRYRSGEVEIQDRTVAERVGEQTRLVRTITFKSPMDTKLWMRPIAGNVEQPMPGQYTIPGLKLTVPTGAATFVRAGSSEKDARELLLRFDLPRGVSTQAFIYELQK
ncbi:MAG TPA: cytochrome c, partial [Pirellulaceae bacterium]|nr:cytochrome c [Pirellulaceae bacterium]